ncbi:MAG: oxygen-independent coproporphyrinogen III oxidase [Bacteroidetes bacterium]|nr:oxygen-independent coproporphyrinogen III oxidase [Bacteroidota bacterium]
MKNLIQKYNIPGPRYTSYPTVPFWDKEGIALESWKQSTIKSFKESNDTEGISLYIHLPFCESLCTFCACHKRITKRHSVEEPYLQTVLKEWDLYCDILVERPKIREIHLGGGTPTFFSSENLKELIEGIFKRADKFVDFEFSYEGHPNHTSEEQLQTLYDLGSRRNSFGIQDYDAVVQKAIHRVQSFDQVKKVNDLSRKIGYESISHDLIFGLPFQTEKSIRDTIKKTIKLKPDRIAYYSYAHVPWIKGVGQRGFDDNDLPKENEKRHLYELGKQLFFDAGYVEIGMDHFALPTDSLHKAMENKKLHRNLMGYTAGKTQLMIGLGMSSISDSWYAFAQNEKTVEAYTEKVNQGIIPIFRGHLLTDTDLIIRKHILNLMCNLETEWSNRLSLETKRDIIKRLSEIITDGLIEISNDKIKVKEEARMFIRNVCMAFDLRLTENKPETRIFSMTI